MFMKYSIVTRIYTEILINQAVDNFTSSRFRESRLHGVHHSHASMLIEMGFAPLEIADRLGHESVKTTLDTYSHLYPDKDQQLADRLNQFRRAVPPEEEFS